MYADVMPYQPTAISSDPLLTTSFSDMPLLRRGKDKDVYDLGDVLLMISTDRLSAAGKCLDQGVTGKGKIVNLLSAYWFRKLKSIAPNHFISADTRCYPQPIRNRVDDLDDRSMLVWKTTPIPVCCIVRGYLAGAGWRDYQERGEICGNKLPKGMLESQRLPAPVFAPMIKKAPDDVPENIDFNSLQRLLGTPLAEQLRDTSLRLYYNAWKAARKKGVLIADTKFEFGRHDGKLMLIDECLTPDTSRFWQLSEYKPGAPLASMDKQILSDYLESLDTPENIPRLPERMLRTLREKYNESYIRIIGSATGQ